MSGDRVVLVADSPGHILERLGRAWIKYGQFDRHDLVCSSVVHPFELRRRAEEGRLVHWIDPLAFALHPNAVRTPQVVMVHHLTEPEVAPMLERLRHADFVTTSSQRWRKRLASMARWDPTVIPYSVDASVFTPAHKSAAAARLGITPGRYVAGFSGRALADMNGRKGVGLFLEVLRAASREWNDLAVALVGQGWESLKSQIEELGIEVSHCQPARTEDTAGAYAAMDVFICTSSEEGGPCTILEAMSTAVPVITTDVGHVPEVITDGVNGFVVPDRDAGSFVRAIRALRADAAVERAIAAEGRQFILRERDERVAMNGVDFEQIYRLAEENFQRRARTEISVRAFPMLYLRMRYQARCAVAALRGQ